MIKLSIADDHAIVLNGLQRIFKEHPDSDIELIGVYQNGDALLPGLALHPPDVLLLDIHMPGRNGIELAGEIRKKYPGIAIIALTNVDILPQVRKMMKQGCMGYLLKEVPPDTLKTAIRQVYNGNQFIYDRIRTELSNSLFARDSEKFLTRRETEILKLIAEELTNQEIATKLHISPHTVENHRNHMLQKLGVKNTAGLVRAAINMGIVD